MAEAVFFSQWVQICFFLIEWSARQGDPISPLIFILALEPLLHNIRKDENIRGIRVSESNEIKLTGYADDVSYFCKDKISMVNVLSKINRFSKVSGLEINKTKSECLILSNETYGDKIAEIPIVQNVKILGHFFGHDKLICFYNNFYKKIPKFEKIFNMWKQRNLTLFGKNLLINSLINSLFLYNSQSF